MLSNTLRLNSGYLKIIHILHPCYHAKILGRTLKDKQVNKCVCIHEIIPLIIMKMKMKKNNRSHRYNIKDLGLGMDTNIVNIKRVSVRKCLYVLSSIYKQHFEAQFMKG